MQQFKPGQIPGLKEIRNAGKKTPHEKILKKDKQMRNVDFT